MNGCLLRGKKDLINKTKKREEIPIKKVRRSNMGCSKGNGGFE